MSYLYHVLQDSWPSTLKTFILQSQHLSLSRSVLPSVAMAAIDVSSKVKVGMTPKKSHEVSKLYMYMCSQCRFSTLGLQFPAMYNVLTCMAMLLSELAQSLMIIT